MKQVLKTFKKVYRKVLHSIAFYPVLISFFFMVFAFLAISSENWSIVRSLKEEVPYLFIQDYETARAILSIFIGGIISLTVFSFSMVMVVLSQASSNFSPRLLPGLVSNSKHQFILGIYIGTLLYCIIIITSLGARGIDSEAMGLSTMFAAVMSVFCIGLFVYFIHNISGAIQIHNIIKHIYEKCHDYAEDELVSGQDSKVALTYIDTSRWKTINSDRSGYYMGFDTHLLDKNLKDKNFQLQLIPYQNQHIWAGTPILRFREELSEEELENLMICVQIAPDRYENDRGIGSLITLMEIAVRAMSPGINDPGTAIDAITKLGPLLHKFLQFPAITSTPVKYGKCVLIINNIPASELIRIVIQPIRLYCNHDSSVMFALIGALKYILEDKELSKESAKVITKELKNLRKDLERNIENKADLKLLITQLEGAGAQVTTKTKG